MAKKLSLKQDNHARKSSASSFFYKIKNAIERAKVNLIRKVSEIILPYLLPDIVIDDPVSLPKKFSKTKRNIKESIRQNEIRWRRLLSSDGGKFVEYGSVLELLTIVAKKKILETSDEKISDDATKKA